MNNISKLFLVVHPMPRIASIRRKYMKLWQELFERESPNEANAVCLLSNSPKEMKDLANIAKRCFGNSCFLDPNDNSDSTKILVAEDLQKVFSNRGNHQGCSIYELWTSNNSRRWAEGLKKEMSEKGCTYEPADLQVVVFGMSWGGCLTKYSAFIPKYLGVVKTPDLRVDLSPHAGYPLKADFKERIVLDHSVSLCLFITECGRPLASFVEGLRGVWEPPHQARVEIDSGKMQILNTLANSYIKAEDNARVVPRGFVFDVSNGCDSHILLLGLDISYDEFRDKLTKASIISKNERPITSFGAPYADPITMTKDNMGEHK